MSEFLNSVLYLCFGIEIFLATFSPNATISRLGRTYSVDCLQNNVLLLCWKTSLHSLDHFAHKFILAAFKREVGVEVGSKKKCSAYHARMGQPVERSLISNNNILN